MYDQSLIQVLYGVLNGTNAATTKRQFINDFTSFILDHIPYAQIRARDLQTGLMAFDGPQATGVHDQKPLLVWHFGGLPYPIVKAAMVEYNYTRMWDGSGLNVHASILFGFQSDGEFERLYTAPRAHVAVQHAEFVQQLAAQPNFIAQLTQTVAALTNTLPSAVVSGEPVKHGSLDELLRSEILSATHHAHSALPHRAGEQPDPSHGVTTEAGPSNGNSATAGATGWTVGVNGRSMPLNIEFDGPARDADSHHVFPYTLETLFNDKEKFDQILWWYFAGQAVRITKAMRIPLGAEVTSPSLFVGFSGPGSFP